MKIGQQQFMQVAERQSISLEKLQRTGGISHEVEVAFGRADRNHDGFIDNAKEYKQLFKQLNKLEKSSGEDRDKRNLNGAASPSTRSVWGLLVDNALNASPPPPPANDSVHSTGGPSIVRYDPRVGKLLDTMLKTAGSGTNEDIQIVKSELSKLPFDVLNRFHQSGGSIRVCRGNVTEYLTQLKDVRPRGWPADKTWNDVQGTYMDNTKEVVIATQELQMSFGDDETLRTLGVEHGSENIVMHEFAHGFDRLVFRGQEGYEDFQKAYEQDKRKLNSEYLTQPGLSGREEAFAECFAYHYNNPSKLNNAPQIQAFFNAHFPQVQP